MQVVTRTTPDSSTRRVRVSVRRSGMSVAALRVVVGRARRTRGNGTGWGSWGGTVEGCIQHVECHDLIAMQCARPGRVQCSPTAWNDIPAEAPALHCPAHVVASAFARSMSTLARSVKNSGMYSMCPSLRNSVYKAEDARSIVNLIEIDFAMFHINIFVLKQQR